MTKTIITADQAIADAKTMTAAEFDKKYEDRIEWLDVDNIMDPNDGEYHVIFYDNRSTTHMLFIDGEYQAD